MSSKGIFRLSVALLAGAFLLSVLLAQQAIHARQLHRTLAMRALQDHAQFAAWQAANHARTEISAVHFGAFIGAIRYLGQHPQEWGDRAWLERIVRQQRDVCACTDGIRFFFTLDPDGRFEPGDASDDPVAEWVRDTLQLVVRASPSVPPAPQVVRSISGTTRRLAVIVSNSTPGSFYGRPGGTPAAVVFLTARDSTGAPVRTYGFVSDPVAFAQPIFARMLEHQRLLPPSVVAGIRADSLLALTVRSPSGGVLFRSPVAFPDSFAATETLMRGQGMLQLQLTLNPALAARSIGGIPDSRLAALVAALLLSGSMMGIVWVILRRQQMLVHMRDDFVATVSHELRTPLAQIRLLAELLHLGRPMPEDVRLRSARVIDQEARRLSLLVENVLSFSRASRRVAPRVAAATELMAEVRDIVDSFLPLAQRNGASVEVQGEGDVHAEIDPAALRQILLNLLDNANRYGPGGQTITVEVGRSGDVAQLRVEDEGAGIPAGEEARIFEPYYTLPHDSPASRVGTGIGLAVVRELVTRNGGRVRVERARGGGARFVVELPAVERMGGGAGVSAPAPRELHLDAGSVRQR